MSGRGGIARGCHLLLSRINEVFEGMTYLIDGPFVIFEGGRVLPGEWLSLYHRRCILRLRYCLLRGDTIAVDNLLLLLLVAVRRGAGRCCGPSNIERVTLLQSKIPRSIQLLFTFLWNVRNTSAVVTTWEVDDVTTMGVVATSLPGAKPTRRVPSPWRVSDVWNSRYSRWALCDRLRDMALTKGPPVSCHNFIIPNITPCNNSPFFSLPSQIPPTTPHLLSSHNMWWWHTSTTNLQISKFRLLFHKLQYWISIERQKGIRSWLVD